MKTFLTEKHNIPEGATHYLNETDTDCFAWYREDTKEVMVGGYAAPEWESAGNDENLADMKPIPQTNIETPEEKEALDLIDTTTCQYESVASKKAEWNSGDKCIYNGDEFLFVGMIPTLDDFSCVIFSDTHGAKRATTIELSKPETQQQRDELIRKMIDDFTEQDLDCNYRGKVAKVCAALYDAGYRKEG